MENIIIIIIISTDRPTFPSVPARKTPDQLGLAKRDILV